MNQPGTTRMSSRARLALLLGLLIGLLAVTGGLTRPAHAATVITVSTCDESHLDAAISQANSDHAGDTITFGCSGDITLTSTLTISGSMTLSGRGQSVYLDGQLSVQVLSVNSGVTFALNALTIYRGGRYNDGGGLYNHGGTVSITNSTFESDFALNGYGGGLLNAGGTVSITNSTFVGNSAYNGGGLINESGTVSIGGSIVAENFGGDCSNVSTINDLGYNLDSDYSCFTASTSLHTNPQLSQLANNGGPTQTMALQQGSPAVDAGAPAGGNLCLSNDQRGNVRPDDAESTCDMGAYESGSSPDADLGLANVPAAITANATGPSGASVSYTPPTATDESGDTPGPSVSCDHASGSTFPIGTTTVTCTATDSDDSNSPVSQGFTVTVNAVLAASGTSVSATEGYSFSGVVATGTAYVSGAVSASIDWGDRNTSAGSVTLNPDGSYSVVGSHTYAEEGTFAITVTVNASGASNATANSSASVSDAALGANAPSVVLGKMRSVTLSMVFSDADPNGTASDYTATISWGDGSSSSATIGATSSGLSASGSHSYAKKGTYSVKVTVTDSGGSQISQTVSVTIK